MFIGNKTCFYILKHTLLTTLDNHKTSVYLLAGLEGLSCVSAGLLHGGIAGRS